MERLMSIGSFAQLQEQARRRREAAANVISVCDGPGCSAAGSGKVAAALRTALDARGLSADIRIRCTGCHGLCECAPVVVALANGTFMRGATPEDAEAIIDVAMGRGELPRSLAYIDPISEQPVPAEADIPFYSHQVRRVLSHAQHIDPHEIMDYIAADGYRAVAKMLATMAPADVVAEVKASGLRGRGGAGFPTGLKWELCARSEGEVKYLICNADEGDPGAYMDRAVLEGNPHSVIEGMIIGAWAMGATKGILYIRAEYPLAVRNAQSAIKCAREMGLLGENILGSELSFDLEITTGAGAFVCGEETALIASIEGQAGVPRPRPPFPAQSGLFGKPTNINNVETWANIPYILREGGESFASVGAENSRGTKIFSLVGKVRNTGLVEVPMGITLREIVFDIGGGPLPGRRIKAVQTGGPSGGCIPAHLLDIAVDYQSLTEVGSIMGSGGLIVMDNKTCMVDIARYFLRFLSSESCGKCTPCREGVPRMLEILDEIADGRGELADLDLLEQIGRTVKNASMCGLGQSAANPVLNSLRHFRAEFEEHVLRRRCEAGICKGIISSPCKHVCPLGTDVPAYIAHIARGEFIEAARAVAETNPLPSVCARVCSHPCEGACTACEAGDAMAVKQLKRFALDFAENTGSWRIPDDPARKLDQRVAIIGSGPAGLTAAYHLARLGYGVTLLEAEDRPGGMLATTIPEYRLPWTTLEKDIQHILDAGVELRTNVRIGRDLAFRDLTADFDAVFVAVGAQGSWRLGVPGEEAEGVHDALDLLRAAKRGRASKPGDRVIVVGGGDVAIDVCRTALRLGSESVRIVYRRTIDEMPADQGEIHEALLEGVEILELAQPLEVVSTDGRVTGLRCARMALAGMGADGRRKTRAIEGEEVVIECDAIVPAIGQEVDVAFLRPTHGHLVSDRERMVADRDTFVTQEGSIFAAGDVLTGGGAVVVAMAAGRRAAESIHQFLSGEAVAHDFDITPPSRDVPPPSLTDEEQEALLEQRRPEQPALSIKERLSGFNEVELGLTEAQAIAEARRCLRCDRA